MDGGQTGFKSIQTTADLHTEAAMACEAMPRAGQPILGQEPIATTTMIFDDDGGGEEDKSSSKSGIAR